MPDINKQTLINLLIDSPLREPIKINLIDIVNNTKDTDLPKTFTTIQKELEIYTKATERRLKLAAEVSSKLNGESNGPGADSSSSTTDENEDDNTSENDSITPPPPPAASPKFEDSTEESEASSSQPMMSVDKEEETDEPAELTAPKGPDLPPPTAVKQPEESKDEPVKEDQKDKDNEPMMTPKPPTPPTPPMPPTPPTPPVMSNDESEDSSPINPMTEQSSPMTDSPSPSNIDTPAMDVGSTLPPTPTPPQPMMSDKKDEESMPKLSDDEAALAEIQKELNALKNSATMDSSTPQPTPEPNPQQPGSEMTSDESAETAPAPQAPNTPTN